ncbi:GCN5 family N-acetyltransferase [Streptomyces globisporus]|uniref:GNAT family N-acetyltransferase n=1 Tax=Streptomyces globisporus TaxID=1908 RepID=UPI00177B2B83|nr:GCN5 family N-acetyltransferase [Streptomyces globisporus]
MMIRPAGEEDVAALMDLRVEAEQWLSEAGIDQWRNPQTRAPALAKWQADIAAGRTWLVEEEGRVLATITLAPPDMDFWQPEDRPEDAVYVAKLITARAAMGRRLGGQLLDWAGHQAQQERKSWVRLDCWRSNTALQSFYVREGFEHVRTEAPAHRLSGWLGQRPASVVLHPDSRLLTG